jgi:hypothetical protein
VLQKAHKSEPYEPEGSHQCRGQKKPKEKKEVESAIPNKKLFVIVIAVSTSDNRSDKHSFHQNIVPAKLDDQRGKVSCLKTEI